MAVYTIARLLEDLKTIARQATSDWFQGIGLQIMDECLATFYSAKWPFNSGEGVFSTVAPYLTGKINLTKDSPNVVGTATVWDPTWPTPAILRPSTGGVNDSFLVNSFNTGTGLTIDKQWPYPNVGPIDYRIDFPSYDVPSYIEVGGLMRSWWVGWSTLQPSTMEAMLEKRDRPPMAFYPDEFYVTPTDGLTPAKIWIWPAPNVVMTIRYQYVKAIPTFYYYRDGSASISNGTTNITGVGTAWKKLGYSIIGQYFEILGQKGVQGLISANTTDTAAALSANWAGLDAATQPYAISPQLFVPDDLKPLLRALVRWKYFQDAVPNMAPMAQSNYQSLLSGALARANLTQDAREIKPIFNPYQDGEPMPPSIPWVLQVAGP